MFGLREIATLTRKVRAGNAPDGTPLFSDSFPWAGRVIRAKIDPATAASRSRYEPVGPAERRAFTIYLPYLTGALAPRSQDVLTIGGVGYTVEAVTPDGWRTHLVVAATLIARA